MNEITNESSLQTSEISKQDLKKGTILGKWTLVEKIGFGGNSQVWKSSDSLGNTVAIKILTKFKKLALQRFKDEIKIMQGCGIEGVIQILDSNLPDSFENDYAWYAMPVGKPLLEYLQNKSSYEKASYFVEIADVLAQLHQANISHRDIKPANIIRVANKAYLADFGLVDYPDKADITLHKDDIGPRWTMAPEMFRHTHNNETRPADVYSLAISLWIVITGQLNGFDGQYDGSMTISIKPHLEKFYIPPLEALLRDATEHNPSIRPKMGEFRDRLVNWLTINSDTSQIVPLEWKYTQKVIFPFATPKQAEWEDLNTIVSILNIIGPRTNFNHLFFPTGGGLDLEKASVSTNEIGCIELVTDGLISLLKPRSLKFESFSKDSEWDYFRLECAPLEPSGVYQDVLQYGYEEVLDIGGGKYTHRYHWDNNELNGEPLPTGSRVISRYFKGAFVIFLKLSKYNSIPGTYDPIHSKLDSAQFREFVERLILRFENSI